MSWLLLAVAFACAVLAGWRGGRTRLIVAVGLLAAWVLAALAFLTDYREADGSQDCWPTCTTLQDAAGVGLWIAPVLLVCLLLTAFVGGVIRWVRA